MISGKRDFPVSELRPGDRYSFLSSDPSEYGCYVLARRSDTMLYAWLLDEEGNRHALWTDSLWDLRDEKCFLLKRASGPVGRCEYDERVARRKLELDRRPGIIQWYRAEAEAHHDDVRLWEKMYSDALQAIADQRDQIDSLTRHNAELEARLDKAADAWDDGYEHGARQALAAVETRLMETRRSLLS